MKRVFSAMLLSGLAATWIGCQSATESTPPPEASSASQAAPESDAPDAAPVASVDASDSTTSEFTLVSLKVPNMT
jgi:hypothetical protein